MENAATNFPKGIAYFNMYSAKEFLDESISQVEETLLIAFVLVFFVVFIFLQDFRSTLDPGDCCAGGIDRYIFLYAVVWLYDKPAYSICICSGYWYCGG